MKKKFICGGIIAASSLITIGLTALIMNIFERKQEAKNPFYSIVEVTDKTEDPSIWGRNFPLQYEGYLQTKDMEGTYYGGSKPILHTPTDNDPRLIVSQSKIEKDSRLKKMLAGYSFSRDFREERGHAFMLEDQIFTERQLATNQPGTCLNCHASTYKAYKELGNGDITRGFEKINTLSYDKAKKLVKHPISCIDCHEPESMQLRITRPSFIEGIRAVKVSKGIENFDVNKDATHQEMRTYVCAQCHVEYYFKGEENRLIYPWINGLKADEILAYYNEINFKDWTHSETEASVLKAQHPEFEMWSQGIHAKSGVSCADCHMPYKRVGALKISDHHVRSPILTINNSCQVCHRKPESDLLSCIKDIQDKTSQMHSLALDAVVDLIDDIKLAIKKGFLNEQLTEARNYQRNAQFLVDFIGAENSTGFHAPQESARILLQSIDYARRGQLSIYKNLLFIPKNHKPELLK